MPVGRAKAPMGASKYDVRYLLLLRHLEELRWLIS